MPTSIDSAAEAAALALERIELLERRAATVAHELNNVLTIVRTYTYFARQGASDAQRARDLRIVAAAAERGTTLTDWLASSSEHEPRAPDDLDAKELLSAVAVRLQLLALAGTNIEILAPSEDLALRANRPRLKHVLVSLVLNANQALSGGRFEFSFERRIVAEKSDPLLDAGAYVVLVLDCHAPAEPAPTFEGASVKEQLARPVLLLGDLVASMNGVLRFAPSAEGVTRLELYLPLAPSPRLEKSITRPTLLRHAGAVLIVEDDAAIRLAMLRTLGHAGYTVLEASDGPAAEEILSNLGHTVKLVVSDIVLPRGSGADLLGRIKVRYPSIAFLLISGREREGATKARELGVGFLGKPFYPNEFLAAVGRAISASESAARETAPAIVRPVVVIVDDDADIRDSFERLLAECDFETYVAKSGLHALQILSERRVDAVVTDQFMPGLDGIGLLELVYERFPNCIRILCTAHPASDIIMQAIDRGRVDRVLTKTMHAVALRDEIERAVLEALHARESRAEGDRKSGAMSEP